jgi:hypothetical protein
MVFGAVGVYGGDSNPSLRGMGGEFLNLGHLDPGSMDAYNRVIFLSMSNLAAS